MTDIDITLSDPDTDLDGLPDYWEALHGFDPDNTEALYVYGWWEMDEPSGTNVSDSSSYGNHGVTSNMATNCWETGVIGNALSFDGQDDYVQLTNSQSLQVYEVSIAMWVKPSVDYTNGSAVFFSKKEVGGAKGYRLADENGELVFYIGAGTGKAVTNTSTFTQAPWYHIDGTYD